MTIEPNTLAILQIVRLKGRASAAMAADSLGLAVGDCEKILQQLQQAGSVVETNGNFRLAPPGREVLAQAVAAERSTVDAVALTAAYHAFHPLNSAYKQLVSDWQIRDGVPNDHADAAYDRGIAERLDALHASFTPLLNTIVSLAPRLAHYPARFERARSRFQAGEHAWMARPIADSYHTVWFELHEDLIGLLGLSREAEAAAGRAE